MAEDGIQAAAFGERNFDLQVSDGAHAGRGVTVAAASLRWGGGECPFGDILTVTLLCDTSDELQLVCSIVRADGSRLTVENTRKFHGESAVYRDFLRAFVERLGPDHRARITFWPLDQGKATVVWGGLLVFCVAMSVWALVTHQSAAAPENVYIVPVMGVLTPISALLFWKSLKRPEAKPLDPDHLDAFLPPIYYDRM